MKAIVHTVFTVYFLLFMPHAYAANEMANHTKSQKNALTSSNEIVINPARLQAIGITFAPARMQMIEKRISTVGRIEVDERNVKHVHVRFDGWIEELFVNYTGEIVQKGQALFTVYSPELVSTQEEFLLALSAQNMLGKNATPAAVAGAKSAFQAAYQRLLLWGISADKIEQLKRANNATRTMTIDSPIQGTVINKVAFAGMRIDPNDELYTIADLSHLWILGDIYENELSYISIGQTADITLTYLPGKRFTANLIFISPTVDPQTRTIKVRFEIDNKKNLLKPGMYVNLGLKIPLGSRLVVPKNAVLLTGERSVIFIYHGDGKIEWRDVQLGARTDDLVEIVQGIKEGDEIITSANFLIDSESQLKAAMGGMQH
jgi:membrane fusion protein, copper/silver efflux system